MPPVLSKVKRSALSIDTKIRILEELDKKRRSRADIASEFKLPKSSLFTIIKNREKILAASKTGVAPDRVRTTEAKNPNMEKALIEWLKATRDKNVPVDGNILKSKAEAISVQMDIVNFKASDGWLQKFKLRHGLSFRKLCGESASVDMSTVNEWKEGRLKRLMKDYPAIDIFNADETALFFKLLPDRTLVFKGESCSGGKRSKERITVMLACNMAGTEKLPLFVIGRSQKPRCFKGTKTLPTKYAANQKAWMTAVLFEDWIRELDRKFAAQNRKVLLVVDNCTAHKDINNLKSIKIEFLPPNVTSVMQPLDQGIIQSWKKHYRGMLLNKIVLCLDSAKEFSFDILGAMHLATAAWNKVSKTTIFNCFRHAGFKAIDNATETNVPDLLGDPDGESDEQVFQEFCTRARIPEAVTFADYTSVDSNVYCAEEPHEDEILNRILDQQRPTEDVSSGEEADDEPPAARPSLRQAADAAELLRKFFEGQENSENTLKKISDIENSVCKCVASLKQSTITGFFLNASL